MSFDFTNQISIISNVSHAPSVHNVQPVRFHFKGNNIFLIEDLTRRIPVGDPTSRDAGFSLGIAAEGLAIALSEIGWQLIDLGVDNSDFGFGDKLITRRRFEVLKSGKRDELSQFVERRYSYRGNFLKKTENDFQLAQGLESSNICVITNNDELNHTAKIYDEASLRFFRNDAFRQEILSWMRLSKSHPQYLLDGLNFEAMAMTAFEAMMANIVLRPKIFPILDKIGLGAPLTAEAQKVTNSAGIILLHRPKGEEFFQSGRHFYRTWLLIVSQGFQAAVMASLADDDFCQSELCKMKNIPPQNRIITAFRIGRAIDRNRPSRARLDPANLIL